MKNVATALFALLCIIGSKSLRAQNQLKLLTAKADTLSLTEPFGLCAGKDGTIYIADVGDHRIKEFKNGKISVFAGNGTEGTKNGSRLQAELNSPSGIVEAKDGSFYIAGFGGECVRKISRDGMMSTVAGTGKEGYRDGAGNEALFSSPRGICIDSKGNLFVCDCWNHRIREISPDGTVSTFAGGGKCGELTDNGWKDGQDTAARFNAPCGISIDQYDNLYVADANNNCLRKITPSGKVTTIAGQGGKKGLKDGPAAQSLAYVPTEVFCAPDGTVYFSDSYNNCVRMLTTDKQVVTLAGNGQKGFTNTSPLKSELNTPRGIVLIGQNLYFTEWGNHCLRRLKITATKR